MKTTAHLHWRKVGAAPAPAMAVSTCLLLGGINPVANWQWKHPAAPWMWGVHNLLVRDGWELFPRSSLSKILPVGWLLFRELGTISGFYRFLSSSALSRCSELNLGRDTECSNSTTAFLALGWARKSQPHCLILPMVFFTAEPSGEPVSPVCSWHLLLLRASISAH